MGLILGSPPRHTNTDTDRNNEQAAAAAMFAERSRSNPGFRELPSVAASVGDQIVTNPSVQPSNQMPPPISHSQQTGANQQVRNVFPDALQSSIPQSFHTPSPADWFGQSSQQPQAATRANMMTSGDISSIRNLLPNLKEMSDEFLANTPMETLIKLNESKSVPIAQDLQIQTAIAAAAAAAAHFAPYNPSVQDPGIKMAKNLEELRKNPTFVPEGKDDRINQLHDARFLAGAVASGVDLWRMAREVIPLEGYVPLANYDLECMGLGGSVTTKGLIEAHNPGSSNLCLKLFSPENLSTSAGAARKFTLADDDGAISVGEHMREITEMNTLQHAMRVLVALTRLIMPWNLSFCALDGFLYASNYGAVELGNDPLRVQKLVKFVNYVLGRNAAAWHRKDPFLSCGMLKQEFGIYLQCQASGAFIPAAAATAPGNSTAQHYQGGGKPKSGGKGRFTRPFYGGGGFRPANVSHPGGGGRGGGRGGYHGGGYQGGGGKGFQYSGNSSPSGYMTPSGWVIICRNYNNGFCKSNGQNCQLPSGARALHQCSAMKQNGDLCKEPHPANQHK